ncbi:MAG: universal stress protein [Sphingobium sp.]
MSVVAAFPSPSQAASQAPLPPGGHDIIVCTDCSDHSVWIVPHAVTFASALHLPVTLLRVLDGRAAPDARPDPIEWSLRRREARRMLDQCAAAARSPSACSSAETAGAARAPDPKTALAEGRAADEICRFMRERDDGMIVIGTRARRTGGRREMGRTVQKVLSRAPGPVLLVPTEAHAPPAAYRRIVVPLDGSCWAESVLPLASRLAKATDAELLLAHIVPAPEMIEATPLEMEDMILQQNVIDRNDRAARGYLKRVSANLAATGLRVKAISARGDDVRQTLGDLIQREGADLVVLSARGNGRHHASDVPYGTVASYLMSHCAVPMLVMPSTARLARPSAPAGHDRLRLPVACLA